MGEDFAPLANFLREIGLGSLFSISADGVASGWLWEQVQNGVTSKEELLVNLENTTEFKDRFKVIFDMRARANRGENVTVPTVPEVLRYESAYSTLMSQANVPAAFYDSFEDAQNAIRNNLTVDQIQDRINVSYGIVSSLPREVRDAFAEFYGDATDGALVAAVLDPEKSLAVLDRQSRAAQLAGFARRQDVIISQQQAEEFASMSGITSGSQAADQAREAAQRIASIKPLAETQMGESTIGDATDVAFRAGALGEADALAQTESRLLTRRLGQQSTVGGASSVQSGLTGSGRAQ